VAGTHTAQSQVAAPPSGVYWNYALPPPLPMPRCPFAARPASYDKRPERLKPKATHGTAALQRLPRPTRDRTQRRRRPSVLFARSGVKASRLDSVSQCSRSTNRAGTARLLTSPYRVRNRCENKPACGDHRVCSEFGFILEQFFATKNCATRIILYQLTPTNSLCV